MGTKSITSVNNALVVGGGIGGMSAAISLAERGVKVELIDLDPEWRVYGAGITITGPTLRAYRRLGMLDEIAQKGAITPGSRIFTFDGIHLQDLDEPIIEAGLPATGGIMRPVLHEIMRNRIARTSIEVRLGLTVKAITNKDHSVQVEYSDGGKGEFDLLVGADSIYSGVRDLAFPHMSAAEETGQGCWRVSIQRPPSLEKGEFYFGHEYSVGITRCGKEDVYLWMNTPTVKRDTPMSDDETFAEMRRRLADFGGNAAWVRDNMTIDNPVIYRPLAAKLQPKPWVMGRTVLLGDAVHATTPHLASGAGMAVESAIVLAEELERTGDLFAGLQAYEDRRFERCRDIVETSISIGKRQLAGASAEEVGDMIGGAMHRLAADF